jgi:bacterial/archaeal transporter family protein
MVFIATIGGIAALIFWGLSDYFTGKSGKEGNNSLTTLVVQAIGFISMLPLVLLYGLSLKLDMSLLVIIGSAIFFFIAYIFFIKAMSLGPAGVAAPIGNSYPLVTLLVAFVFLKAELPLSQVLALLTIIAGVITLAADRTLFNHRNLRGSTVFYAFITMVTWGLAFALLDLVIDKYAWYQLLFLLASFTTLFSLLYYIMIHKTMPNWQVLRYGNTAYAWQAGLLLIIGTVAFFMAIEQTGSVVIPAVIASASPLVTSFLAYVRDKEKLSLYKRVGAIIVVLGLVLLNFA